MLMVITIYSNQFRPNKQSDFEFKFMKKSIDLPSLISSIIGTTLLLILGSDCLWKSENDLVPFVFAIFCSSIRLMLSIWVYLNHLLIYLYTLLALFRIQNMIAMGITSTIQRGGIILKYHWFLSFMRFVIYIIHQL